MGELKKPAIGFPVQFFLINRSTPSCYTHLPCHATFSITSNVKYLVAHY